MAYKKVEAYYLTFQGKPKVWVRIQGDSALHIVTESSTDALFVTDMLRNEKPVHFDPDHKTLSTSAEIVGEEESTG